MYNSMPLPFFPGLLSPRELGRIHSASLEILRDTGMVFGSEEALEIFKSRGFRTEGDRVYFTDKQVEKALESVSNDFVLAGRNPENDVKFNLNSLAIGAGGGAIYVVAGDGSFRSSTKEDYIQAAKLAQVLPGIKICRCLFIPNDIEAEKLRHWMMAQQIILEDKPYHLVEKGDIPLLALAFGKTTEEMRDSALAGYVYGQSSVNVISPLYLSAEACDNLIAFCRAGVAFNLAPMPAAGSTAPCSLTATAIQQNCEVLGPLVLSQLVTPGIPVLYGAIGGHSDMRTMGAVYGAPESRRVELAGAQLAKYYGMLSRGDVGMTDAPACDFQAGAESMFQFMNVMGLGMNFLPGCGHLGSFLGASLEKMVMDAELAEYVFNFLQPFKFNENDLATDLIKETGPKGNYLTCPHTFKRFKTEFYDPRIFNRQPYEKWEKMGSPLAGDLASKKVREYLDLYKKPAIDPALEKELLKYC